MRLGWKYLGLVTPLLGGIYAACSSAGGGGSGGPSNHVGTGGNGGFQVGNTGGNGFIVGDAGSEFESTEPKCTENCEDFPAEALNPENIDTAQFDGAASGTGPCIIEPQDGTLFPRNWLRPRVNFYNATAGRSTNSRSRRARKRTRWWRTRRRSHGPCPRRFGMRSPRT